MSRSNENLLENHLAFLASHRGAIRRMNETLFVESDRPEFTYAILGKSTKLEALPLTVQTVQNLPWSGVATAELAHMGFAYTIGLSYMVLEENQAEWRIRNDLAIEQVHDQAHMDLFSEVQGKGFNESRESYAHWHPWLKAANDRNLSNPNHVFYVGHLEGKPIGTVLFVFSGETAGIYAVATLPDHRKQGVSTTILNQAIRDARARGAKVIMLQVKQDSYVEDFYRKLGFKRVFTTGIFHLKS